MVEVVLVLMVVVMMIMVVEVRTELTEEKCEVKKWR